jgi:hypothetical protein
MNILFLCHRFPYPPKEGGKIRAFNMIRHLSAAHHVTVCSLARSPVEAEEGRGIAPYCSDYVMTIVNETVQKLRMVVALPTLTPSSMGYFYSREHDKKVQALLAERQWDLIVVHCSSAAQYVLQAKGVPKILDFCDMDSQKWLEYTHHQTFPMSLGYWLEGRKLMREEKRLAKRFDISTVATHAEQISLDGFGTGAVTDWFPNGVDTEYFQPDGGTYDPDTISFVGRMDYYPNEECMVNFCAQVLPRLQAVRPSTKLVIVGANPTPKVKALAELPGVSVTGSVPDVRPYVLRSALAVAPLSIARGTQNKILEAMALGVPVVSSDTAAGGVDALAEEHFLVAANPEAFAQAILRVLDSPEERARLAENARQRMLDKHSWASAMNRFDGIIERCLQQAQSRRSGL